MHNYPSSLMGVFTSFWKHRSLIWQLAKREVLGRYRGSAMGLLWSFINPVLMLIIYTFVFSVVLNVRWGIETSSRGEFAIVLFAGLIIHGLFAECVSRAPLLILSNVNYVKKVVFPLEILPWIAVVSALFHSVVSIFVLLLFYLILHLHINTTIIFLPIVLFPLILLTMGVSWFLASIGVYLRDVSQTTGIVTTAMLFLAPVFYPITALPEAYRSFIYLNPLTFVIEQIRNILLWGKQPDWAGLGIYFVVSIVIAWLGLFWFQRTRRGFADVL